MLTVLSCAGGPRARALPSTQPALWSAPGGTESGYCCHVSHSVFIMLVSQVNTKNLEWNNVCFGTIKTLAEFDFETFFFSEYSMYPLVISRLLIFSGIYFIIFRAFRYVWPKFSASLFFRFKCFISFVDGGTHSLW